MEIELPIYLEGVYGKMGNVILYRRFGKTWLRKRSAGYNKTATPKQAPVRTRFADAIIFARSVVNDPELKKIYEAKANKQCTAYAKAISEYMKGRAD